MTVTLNCECFEREIIIDIEKKLDICCVLNYHLERKSVLSVQYQCQYSIDLRLFSSLFLQMVLETKCVISFYRLSDFN